MSTAPPPAAPGPPGPLRFRPAAPSDAPALVALVNGAYRGTPAGAEGWTSERGLVQGPRLDAARLAALDRPGSLVLVAERDGVPVGCVHLQRLPGPGRACLLGMLSVRVGDQAGGIGKALMAEAEGVARDQLGARVMVMKVVSVRAELLAWYERRGYRRTGLREAFVPPPGERVPGPPLEFERLEKSLGP